MATKKKVKAKNWLNLKLVNVQGRKFGYVAVTTNMLSSLALWKADYTGGEQTQFLDSLTSTQWHMTHNGALEGSILTKPVKMRLYRFSFKPQTKQAQISKLGGQQLIT